MSTTIETTQQPDFGEKSLPHQVLTPFVMDTTWVEVFIPESREFADAWNNIGLITPAERRRNIGLDPEDIERAEEFVNTRNVRRSILGGPMASLIHNSHIAAIHIAMEEGHADFGTMLRDLLGSKVRKNPDVEKFVAGWAVEIQDALPLYRRVRQTSFALDAQMKDSIGTSISGQYEVLKTLLDADSSNKDVEDTTPQEVLLFMLNLAEMQHGDGLVGHIADTLDSDGFEEPITHDVIQFIASNEDNQLEELGALNKLWKYSRSINPDLTGEQLAAAVIAGKEYWPEEVRRALSGVRNVVAGKLRAQLERVGDLAVKNGYYMPKEDLRKIFEGAFGHYVASASGRVQRQIFEPHEVAKINFEARRKRPKNGNHTAVQEEANVTATAEERTPEPLSLFVRTTGEIYPEGSDEFMEAKASYLAQYPGPNLEKDLTNILSHMRNFDFSKGLVRGVAKLHGCVKTGGQEYNVYSFKPKDAPGLSIKSDRAKRLRVIFTLLDNGRVALIDLADAASLTSIEKSLFSSNGSGL